MHEGEEEEVIDLVDDAAVEDIKFACTWYDDGKRYKQVLTALISCALLLDEARPTDRRAGSLMDDLCRELQRQLLLGPRARGCRTDSEDCVLAATLALIHRLHGDVQACAEAVPVPAAVDDATDPARQCKIISCRLCGSCCSTSSS